ncbi:MAG: RuvX/YqgF family protein [bacterium]|nr:RuvX/YqgF family protein [bacterium]
MIKKYLGIDYGTERFGLAIADDESKTAVVCGTVSSVDDIIDIAKKESIDVMVVGTPYSIVNKDNVLPKDFQKFKHTLAAAKGIKGIEIVFADERLSSKYADSLIGDKKTKAGRDEIAALSILQNYLDRL